VYIYSGLTSVLDSLLSSYSQIKHTPNGVGRHVFMDDKPFNDSALYPIMRLMGFSVPEKRLEFTAPDDVEDDVLAAGIIVILFSQF
jgi:hypothetical protein